MGTVGDIILIDGIILIFESGSCIKRNICFREMFFNTKSITAKKTLIAFYDIKNCIAKKCQKKLVCRMEKIYWMIKVHRNACKEYLRVLPVDA